MGARILGGETMREKRQQRAYIESKRKKKGGKESGEWFGMFIIRGAHSDVWLPGMREGENEGRRWGHGERTPKPAEKRARGGRVHIRGMRLWSR